MAVEASEDATERYDRAVVWARQQRAKRTPTNTTKLTRSGNPFDVHQWRFEDSVTCNVILKLCRWRKRKRRDRVELATKVVRTLRDFEDHSFDNKRTRVKRVFGGVNNRVGLFVWDACAETEMILPGNQGTELTTIGAAILLQFDSET